MAETIEKKHHKPKKISIWHITTVIFAVLFVGALIALVIPKSGMNPSEAGNKVVDYINNNLIQTGTSSLASVQEVGGIYEVIISYQGKEIPVFVTKDGGFLFVSSPINMTKAITQTAPQEIPKTAKPSVELYVMSFCPYGIQAENLIKPVFDLLGNTTSIKVRFIASVGGNTVDSVQSLHGLTEAQEDLRQLCIMKYYDSKTYWNYLEKFNADCPSVRADAKALESCWKNSATKVGINTSKIQACANGTESLDLLKLDENLANTYGITGSPTILINSIQYNGDRSSGAFKQAICNSFTNSPAACSQNLSSSTGSVTGGC